MKSAQQTQTENEILFWIIDQLTKDIEESNSNVKLLHVTPVYYGFSVRLQQYSKIGHLIKFTHDLSMGHGGQFPAHYKKEDSVRKYVTRRFERILKNQSMLYEKYKDKEGNTIPDFSSITVDAPLISLLEKYAPDQIQNLLVEAVKDKYAGINVGINIYSELSKNGISDYGLNLNRTHIQSAFTINLPEGKICWKRGSMNILTGVVLPESTLLGLRGKPLSTVIEHPLIDGSFTITSAAPVKKEGIEGINLNLKGYKSKLPEDVIQTLLHQEKT